MLRDKTKGKLCAAFNKVSKIRLASAVLGGAAMVAGMAAFAAGAAPVGVASMVLGMAALANAGKRGKPPSPE